MRALVNIAKAASELATVSKVIPKTTFIIRFVHLAASLGLDNAVLLEVLVLQIEVGRPGISVYDHKLAFISNCT